MGGVTEIVAGPVPPGLGSHIQWDRRLDGHIAQAMMSIPAVKAVEIGNGAAGARVRARKFMMKYSMMRRKGIFPENKQRRRS